MKNVVILCGTDCVYCKKAKMLIRRAVEKNHKYRKIKLDYVFEDSPEGSKYSHSLIPAFFIDNTLYFEGNPDMQKVKSFLDEAQKF